MSKPDDWGNEQNLTREWLYKNVYNVNFTDEVNWDIKVTAATVNGTEYNMEIPNRILDILAIDSVNNQNQFIFFRDKLIKESYPDVKTKNEFISLKTLTDITEKYPREYDFIREIKKYEKGNVNLEKMDFRKYF